MYYGYFVFGLEIMGKYIFFDFFILFNELVVEVDVDKIKVDYIFVFYGYQDYVVDVEFIVKCIGVKIIFNFEIVSWYGEKGLEGYFMNYGGKVKFDFGIVKYVNVVYFSVLFDGIYGGNFGGFVIWNEEGCLYFVGDIVLIMDMKFIFMICLAFDVVILFVGDNFIMGYEDVLMACDFIDCDWVVGCYYDIFGYIKIDYKAV